MALSKILLLCVYTIGLVTLGFPGAPSHAESPQADLQMANIIALEKSVPETPRPKVEIEPLDIAQDITAAPIAPDPGPYRLGNGDKIKVTVFGEPDLSGELNIDGAGMISMPLLGGVEVGDKTVREAEEMITGALKGDYLKNPRVSVEVLTHRPFYILGEVRRPGSYNFIDGMNVLKAIALSGGFTYRAERESVEILRGDQINQKPQASAVDAVVYPGDIILVKERFF